MIFVERLEEPRVLAENKDRWRERYLEERARSPRKRPLSAQYAHKQIITALEAMSSHKCFYCEQSTKQCEREVDHFIEVAERPDLAFTWANLYLTCAGCNKKLPNSSIPAADCLDPCDPTERPAEHLTFDDELIRPRSSSRKGLVTIQKYKLDRPELDHKRGRQLRVFDKAVRAIQDRMIAEGRKLKTEEEKELLRSFRQQGQPFSLMFAVYTRELDG